MNYKNIFDKYKKGLANDEEKELVENEIEKFEALEDYFSFNEDSEEENDIYNLEIHKEETKKLKKSVNNKLRNAITKWLIIIIVAYFMFFYGLSGIVDMLYYDPTSTSESEKMEDMKQDFIYDMQSYVSLNKPGYSIGSIIRSESKGFGNYEANYYYEDLFEEKEANYFFEISKGDIYKSDEGIFSFERKGFEGFRLITHRFSEDEESEEGDLNRVKSNNQKTIDYLNNLNPLSYISISIVFNEDMTMREYFDFSQELKSLKFKWVGIRTIDKGDNWKNNNSNSIIGFNPNFNDEPSSTMRPNIEKYPLFYIRDIRDEANSVVENYPEVISKAYETHFKTRLDYLRNREDFVKIMGNKKEFYDYSADYVKKNGVNTYGVLVYGTAEEFLKHIDKIPYESIIINDVLSVKPEIYYN